MMKFRSELRVTLFMLLFLLTAAGNAVSQSEFLINGQSGVTVSASRFGTPWSSRPKYLSTFAVTGTINDAVDLSFSYTAPINGSYRPVKTLGVTAHLNSRAPKRMLKFALVAETNIGNKNVNTYFVGMESYQRVAITRKVLLVPVLTGGLLRIEPERRFSFSSSESQFAGGFSLGIVMVLAKDVKLTIAPFYNYNFTARTPDFVGISVGLTIHSLGKARRNSDWDESSFED